MAIGDAILDLEAVLAAGLFEGEAKAAAEATRGGALNAFFALGRGARVALRERLLVLLGEHSEALLQRLLGMNDEQIAGLRAAGVI